MNVREPEQAEKIKKRQELKRQRELTDLRFLLSIPEGRRFIWRILSTAKILAISFTGNSETFYNEGRRSVGVWLLSELANVDPLAYANLTIEFLQDELKEE